MLNYYKYLPLSAEDESWGLSVLNAGSTHVLPGTAYPGREHPAHHSFDWAKGRVLQEHQVIYITGGTGSFESDNGGKRKIGAGTIILLFPGERHRYRPDKKTGWDEYWVGFRGAITQRLFEKKFFRPENPIIDMGFNEELLSLFQGIIDHAHKEKAGYQPLVAGIVMHILGLVYTRSQQDKFEGQDIDPIVDKARVLFRANIEQQISPTDVARELQISYSRFRKIFKEYTGLAPGQFQIQLKIHRAKELLADPGKLIKEIAYDLNFESGFYFSKLFKEKTGLTPQQFRRRLKKP